MPNCILRCSNSTRIIRKSETDITFHRFPRVGDEKRLEWIIFAQKNRRDDTWLPSPSSYVCSVHFRDEDSYKTKTGRRFLKKSAVPCENPKYCADVKDGETSPISTLYIDVSDSDSIFDSSREIELKKLIRKITNDKEMLSEKNRLLSRQCRYWKKRTIKLNALVEKLKSVIPKKKRKRLFLDAEVVEVEPDINMLKNE